MFPSIDNQSDLQAVENALEARQEEFPPTDCIIEALKYVWNLRISIFLRRMILPKVLICLA